jgi:hypothetical protein
MLGPVEKVQVHEGKRSKNQDPLQQIPESPFPVKKQQQYQCITMAGVFPIKYNILYKNITFIYTINIP